MQPTETKYGEAIRRARQKRDESQQSVADAVGISKAFVSEMETGDKKEPGARIVVAIARHLQLDPLRMLRLARKDFAVWAKAFGWTAPKREAK